MPSFSGKGRVFNADKIKIIARHGDKHFMGTMVKLPAINFDHAVVTKFR